MLLNFITTPQTLPTRSICTGAFLKTTNSIASKIVCSDSVPNISWIHRNMPTTSGKISRPGWHHRKWICKYSHFFTLPPFSCFTLLCTIFWLFYFVFLWFNSSRDHGRCSCGKKMKNMRRPGSNGQKCSRDKGEEEQDKENQVYRVDFEMFFT